MFQISRWPLRKRLRAATALSPAARTTLEDFEQLDPIVKVQDDGMEVTYCTPKRFVKWRVDMLFRKEPDISELISGFSAGGILIDIGADAGMHAIWAIKAHRARVFAYRPEFQKFELLDKNFAATEPGHAATVFWLPMSDQAAFTAAPHRWTTASGCESPTAHSHANRLWCAISPAITSRGVPTPASIAAPVLPWSRRQQTQASGDLVLCAARLPALRHLRRAGAWRHGRNTRAAHVKLRHHGIESQLRRKAHVLISGDTTWRC